MESEIPEHSSTFSLFQYCTLLKFQYIPVGDNSNSSTFLVNRIPVENPEHSSHPHPNPPLYNNQRIINILIQAPPPKHFIMVKENDDIQRSETLRKEGFQEVNQDLTMVEGNHENQRSETRRNEGFKRFNTSPWLKKILKFIDMKRTEIKDFKRLNTSPWLKKILKIRSLKSTEMKVFNKQKTSLRLKKILKIIELKRTEMKVFNKQKTSP